MTKGSPIAPILNPLVLYDTHLFRLDFLAPVIFPLSLNLISKKFCSDLQAHTFCAVRTRSLNQNQQVCPKLNSSSQSCSRPMTFWGQANVFPQWWNTNWNDTVLGNTCDSMSNLEIGHVRSMGLVLYVCCLVQLVWFINLNTVLNMEYLKMVAWTTS